MEIPTPGETPGLQYRAIENARNDMANLIQYFKTIKHLKPVQIRSQMKRTVCSRILRQKPGVIRKAPSFPGCQWTLKGPFPSLYADTMSHDDILNGCYTFLNQTYDLGFPPNWTHADPELLWRYNLQYFNWIWVLDYTEAKQIITSWLDTFSTSVSSPAWDPYPISLRLLNWCGFLFDCYRQDILNDIPFLTRVWESIFNQSEHLFRHPEYHLLGNHLFENAVALTFVGSCFGGADAERWRKKGLSILSVEIPEQILNDGMHFERSPMYHLRILHTLLMLLTIDNADIRSLCEKPARRMLKTLQYIVHPDDDIALFNDSALHVYCQASALRSLGLELLGGLPCHTIPKGAWALPDSGYYGVYQPDDDLYVMYDAGDIGPEYIPGHAHGDLFSFEMSLRGHRIFVDSGTFNYRKDRMRAYCRSTRAHNTVSINDKDQSEFWAAFRVASRAHPSHVLWEPRPDGFEISGEHDGYKRLPGAPVHQRTFTVSTHPLISIQDIITAHKVVSATSRLHLHPSCQVLESNHEQAIIQHPDGRLAVSYEGDGELQIEESLYCPEFHIKKETTALAYTCRGKQLSITTTIEQI